MSDEQFFFDDFFGGDEAVELTLEVKGRTIPLKVKRSLTLEEKVKAQSVGVKRKVNPTNGKVVIDRIDEAAASLELAYLYLVSWPFVFKDGTPVPITREHINQFLGAEALLNALSQQIGVGAQENLAPFAKPSGEV